MKLDIGACTLPDFVAHLRGVIPAFGGVSIAEARHPLYGPGREVKFITGGYSDCEELQGRLERTMFHLMFWESSHRGGMTRYFILDELWNDAEPWAWGENLRKKAKKR